MNNGDHAAWELTLETPAPFDVTLTGTGFTPLPDGMMSLIDAQTGLRVDLDDDAFGFDPHVGALLQPGHYWLVVREYHDDVGTFDLNVEAPIRYEDPVNLHTLRGLAKEGDLLAIWASAFEIPPVPLLPGFINGFLQIDLGSALLADAQFVGPSGRTTGPTLPLGFVYVAQGAVFPGGNFPIDMTELLR